MMSNQKTKTEQREETSAAPEGDSCVFDSKGTPHCPVRQELHRLEQQGALLNKAVKKEDECLREDTLENAGLEHMRVLSGFCGVCPFLTAFHFKE